MNKSKLDRINTNFDDKNYRYALDYTQTLLNKIKTEK